MFSLGSLTFLSPWILGALAVVPALWWLLRVMPPRPRTVKFPPFFLLKDLKTDIRTAARTPWWLLLLRSLLVICIVLSLADPVRQMTSGLPGKGGAVLIGIDNGWAAAANWAQRVEKVKELLPQIRRSGRAVIFLPTAPSETDAQVHGSGPMDTDEAARWIQHLAPHPWPTDYKSSQEAAAEILKNTSVTHSIFISDGTTDRSSLSDLMDLLQRQGGGLTVVRDDKVNTPFILKKTSQKTGTFSFRIEKLPTTGKDNSLSLMAFGAEGGILDEYKFAFPSGEKQMDVTWDILPELRNKVERVALRSPAMASAVFLTDSRGGQHSVGILSDPVRKESKNFLNEVYYLRRALEDTGAILVDVPDALMKKNLSAIIWPDSAPMTETERAALLGWVQAGGFLIRFAGPGLAANPDDQLLPVKLRYGQRTTEGAMTWESPVKLGAIPDASPFFGLNVPADVTVTRQILADPTPESFEKTWLQLEDGTPLATGGSIGKGVVALIHTTAGPNWSNFCYSGLYVEALQRMVSLSTGISDYKAQAILPPLLLMDGFGQLQAASGNGIAKPIDPAQAFTPSPSTPPGLYGDRQEFHVFNLGDALPPLQKLEAIPTRAEEQGYALSGEKSMKAEFFKLALLLLLLDTLITMGLRGIFALRRTAATYLLIALFAAHPALANETDDKDLASGITLAYVETGDQDTDQISYNGLTSLAEVLKVRTTVKVKSVRAVDPAADKLYYYPVLYWPMTESQIPLSATAARNLQNYMAEGGMIFFDTRDQQFGGVETATPGTRKLREIAANLQVPELAPVTEGHILTKSFYLLDEFPGRVAGGKLWAEKEPNQSYDAVTSVIIGSNDYAAAWSKADRARFDIEPGGEQQREMAYRVGVNIVMTALAGNYKADQVHIPYILERLGK